MRLHGHRDAGRTQRQGQRQTRREGQGSREFQNLSSHGTLNPKTIIRTLCNRLLENTGRWTSLSRGQPLLRRRLTICARPLLGHGGRLGDNLRGLQLASVRWVVLRPAESVTDLLGAWGRLLFC